MKHRGKYGAALLVAAALGVLAFATSAQAVTDALESGFFVGGVQTGVLKVNIGGKQVGRGTLLIAALSTEINCEKFSIVSGSINSTTDASGELLYEECTALNLGGALEELAGCEFVVTHEGGAQKHHITASGLILPAELTDGTPAILVENIDAKVLTKPETGCLLPKTTLVTGELCIKIDNNHTTEPLLLTNAEIQGLCKARLALNALGLEINGTHAEILAMENATPKTAFLDELKFGANPAIVDGHATAFATGEHAGKTLGVLLI